MSDFKRKIEIVESTTPPPNKSNWWFDLNENVLKRWKGADWSQYDYTWPTTELPPQDEIWIYEEYPTGDTSVRDNLKSCFGAIGTVLEVSSVYNEDDGSERYKIKFAAPLSKIEVEESISLNFFDGPIQIIFPNLDSISNSFSEQGLFYFYSGDVTVIFGNLNRASGCIFEIMDSGPDIYIYARKVPEITAEFVREEYGQESVYVYVPSTLRQKYAASTNWAQYTIKTLD
jgi:hypothetical protein